MVVNCHAWFAGSAAGNQIPWFRNVSSTERRNARKWNGKYLGKVQTAHFFLRSTWKHQKSKKLEKIQIWKHNVILSKKENIKCHPKEDRNSENQNIIWNFSKTCWKKWTDWWRVLRSRSLECSISGIGIFHFYQTRFSDCSASCKNKFSSKGNGVGQILRKANK